MYQVFIIDLVIFYKNEGHIQGHVKQENDHITFTHQNLLDNEENASMLADICKVRNTKSIK